MNRDKFWTTFTLIAAFSLLSIISLTGCQGNCPRAAAKCDPNQTQAVVDAEPELTIVVAERDWPERYVYYPTNSVDHPLLFMQDAYEFYGGNDGRFETWRPADAFSVILSPTAFLINAVSLPMDVLLSPAWQTEQSRSVYSDYIEPAYQMPSEPAFASQDSAVADN